MKAYVLGLPGSFRGDALLEQLRSLGFDAEMVAGVDGRTMSEAEFADVYDDARSRITCGRSMAPSEIACTLGHRRMFERMLADGGDWALLFEDDAKLDPAVVEVLSDLRALPARSIVTLRQDEAGALVCNPFVRGPRSFRRLVAVPQGASAYFVDRAAAELVVRINAEQPVDGAPDWPVPWATRVHWWVSRQNLSPHRDSHSMLGSGRDERVREFTPPWGSGGLRDRIGWAVRLRRGGYPLGISIRTALTQPLLSRVLRLAMPRASRPDQG